MEPGSAFGAFLAVTASVARHFFAVGMRFAVEIDETTAQQLVQYLPFLLRVQPAFPGWAVGLTLKSPHSKLSRRWQPLLQTWSRSRDSHSTRRAIVGPYGASTEETHRPSMLTVRNRDSIFLDAGQLADAHLRLTVAQYGNPEVRTISPTEELTLVANFAEGLCGGMLLQTNLLERNDLWLSVLQPVKDRPIIH